MTFWYDRVRDRITERHGEDRMKGRITEREKVKKSRCQDIERNNYVNIEITKYYDNNGVGEYDIKLGATIFKERQ